MPASINLFVPDDEQFIRDTTMTIEELAGKERFVTLCGTGMPHMGAQWGVKHQLPTQFYPGNLEGSQQSIGGQMMPSEWEGTWKRTLLGRTPCYVGNYGAKGVPIVNPDTLADVFEDICLCGSRLRVKWRKLVREGRMEEFTRAHGRVTDIGWHAKFSWINRGHNADRRVLGVRGSSEAELDDAMLEAEMTANLEPTRLLVSNRPAALPKGTPQITLGQISRMFNAPAKMVSDLCRAARKFEKNLQQVTDLARQARNVPANVYNTIMNEAENTLAIANATYDNLSNASPEQRAVKRNAEDVVRNAVYLGTVLRQSQVLAGKCEDVRSTAMSARADAAGSGTESPRSSTQQDPSQLTVHQVREGETLVTISMKHYGNPDRGLDIARANHLSYPCPPDPGGKSIGGKRILIVPALSQIKGS